MTEGLDLYDAFITAFSEFKPCDKAVVVSQLDRTIPRLSRNKLGEAWQEALFLRAAHALAIRLRMAGASAAAVTSMSAGTGSLSQSTASNALMTGDNPSEVDFSRTNYGLEYLALLRETIAPCSIG